MGTSGRVSDAHEVGVAASGTTTDPKTMVKYAREPANSTKSAKAKCTDLRVSLQEHQGERHGHQEDGTAAGQAVPRGRPGAQALHRLPQVLRWSRKDRPGQERGIH